MRWWWRPVRRRPWKASPTLRMRLKDPKHPDRYRAGEVVVVTPQVWRGVPQVHLWVQSGPMAGVVFLSEEEARALAKALIEGIEVSKSAAAADEPGLL